jgi:hypothetical protein
MSPSDELLGTILVRMTAVRESALDEALEVQAELRAQGIERDVGTILCDAGELSTEDLAAAVALQHRLRGGDPFRALADIARTACARTRRLVGVVRALAEDPAT